MQRRTKIIVILAVIVILIAIASYFYVNKRAAQQLQEPSQLAQPIVSIPPSNFSMPSKSEDKMTLTTSQGDIETNNLYKNPVANLSNNGVAFKESLDYQMNFYPQDEGFIISILNPDIQKARNVAEADFLAALGITKDQACQLKVTLGVPYSVNPQASGRNYGLSFCPNGIPF